MGAEAATASGGSAAARDADRAQRRTALASIVAAAVLVVLKLGTGLASGSLALISAGIESSGDVVAALLTLVAVRTALRPADSEHNYGHDRAQNLAALGEAAIVAAGGGIIAFESIRQLAEDDPSHVDATWFLFAVIGVAIVIDVSRIVISSRAAARYGSAAFRSNAFNFAGDLAGSLAVLIGLLLVAAGWQAGDAVAALVVSGVIFFAVGRLILENARVLMDYAPEDVRNRMLVAIAGVVPADDLRRLRLREVAGRFFADVTIGLSPAAAVSASHDLADRIESAVVAAVPNSDVVVHIEPQESGVELRDREGDPGEPAREQVLEQVRHRELGVVGLLHVGGRHLVGHRHVAEQGDEGQHDGVERQQRHVALDDVAPLGGQHAGDRVRVDHQGQRRAERQGGERQLAVGRGGDEHAVRLARGRVDGLQVGLAGGEDVPPAADPGRQVEDRHDDHQVDQRVLDEGDQRGCPKTGDEGEDREHQERDEQRQVLDEGVARRGADAHHREHGLDAHQLQRDVGHQREDAGEGDGQRQAA